MNPNPHELAPLLLALGRAGIELAPHPTDAGRLRHRPADLPPDLSARLRIYRAAVVGLLVDGYAPAGDDAGYVLGERLGVAGGGRGVDWGWLRNRNAWGTLWAWVN